MNAYVTFTKKRMAVLFAVFICIVFVCYQFYVAGNNVQNAKTNADRLVFIKQAGYTVIDKNPTVESVTIPTVFYNVYNSYNLLQKQAGYNLLPYKGCEVMRYTYKIETPENYGDEWVINILVYNDRVIGGDVSSTVLDGYMLPIEKVK